MGGIERGSICYYGTMNTQIIIYKEDSHGLWWICKKTEFASHLCTHSDILKADMRLLVLYQTLFMNKIWAFFCTIYDRLFTAEEGEKL